MRRARSVGGVALAEPERPDRRLRAPPETHPSQQERDPLRRPPALTEASHDIYVHTIMLYNVLWIFFRTPCAPGSGRSPKHPPHQRTPCRPRGVSPWTRNGDPLSLSGFRLVPLNGALSLSRQPAVAGRRRAGGGGLRPAPSAGRPSRAFTANHRIVARTLPREARATGLDWAGFLAASAGCHAGHGRATGAKRDGMANRDRGRMNGVIGRRPRISPRCREGGARGTVRSKSPLPLHDLLRFASRPDGIVQRDHLMVFAALLCRDPDMRAALTHFLVAQSAQRRHQGGTADIARQLHATRTSSRT